MTREEKIAELINIRDNFNYTLAPREVFDDAIKALEQEPRKGRWKKGDSWSEGCGMGENYGHYYECSNCGRTVKDDYMKCSYDYCPYCGSDNREVEE